MSSSFTASLWPSIDVALAVGTRFFHPIVEWGRDDAIRLIRIDIDPLQSAAAWPPDVHIVADARAALTRLIDCIPATNDRRDNRQAQFAQMKAAKEDELGRILAPQRAYTKVIRDALPEDGIVCFDVTQLHFYSWWGFPAYRPRTVIQPGYQGTLGYGYPTALGAKVAYPDRPVVYIGGDGGFMFGVQELATAVQYNIGVVVLLFNNNSYGNVRRDQRERFDGRVVAADLVNPDFVKLAESFGVGALRVTSAEAFRPALEKALADGGPYLIDIEVPRGSEASPWTFIHPAKP